MRLDHPQGENGHDRSPNRIQKFKHFAIVGTVLVSFQFSPVTAAMAATDGEFAVKFSILLRSAKEADEIGGQINAMQAAMKNAVGPIEGIGATIGEVSEVATAIASALRNTGSDR